MPIKLIPIIIFSLISGLLSAEPLRLGANAPQLSAIDHEGNTVDLGATFNKGTTVVFFYPKAMTPGCTKQACSLRDAWEVLQQRGVTIFGVSSDTAKTQMEFRNKHKLPFTLIADTDQAVSKAFGKKRFSRQAYIFKDGKLVWLDLKASTATQADDVLDALDQ
jgi:peroxiredoxin Q/BCP